MYTVVVSIPNAPLMIQHSFSFTDITALQNFTEWLVKNKVDYSISFTPMDSLDSAIGFVQFELKLAFQGDLK